MKRKVNSGMIIISFSYLFLLHQLYADWRHCSASINRESTRDFTGALGNNSHLGKHINETNCCVFSVHANSVFDTKASQ